MKNKKLENWGKFLTKVKEKKGVNENFTALKTKIKTGGKNKIFENLSY
jgi:hypothetical protein